MAATTDLPSSFEPRLLAALEAHGLAELDPDDARFRAVFVDALGRFGVRPADRHREPSSGFQSCRRSPRQCPARAPGSVSSRRLGIRVSKERKFA